ELRHADEEREPEDADTVAPADLPRLGARGRHPDRRVRLLKGLWDDAPRRHADEPPRMAEGILRPHPRDHLERLLPHRARQPGVDPESGLLVLSRAAGDALQPAVGQDYQHGDTHGDTEQKHYGVRQGHDNVPAASPWRP